MATTTEHLGAMVATVQENMRDRAIEVRIRPAPDNGGGWVPMTGWGVHQRLTIAESGMFDQIEFRDPGTGDVLFVDCIPPGQWVGIPVRMLGGDEVDIRPTLHIDGVLVLPEGGG